MPINWFFSRIETLLLLDNKNKDYELTEKLQRNAYYCLFLLLYLVLIQLVMFKYATITFIFTMIPILFRLYLIRQKNLQLLTIIETVVLSMHPYILGFSQKNGMDAPLVSIFVASACFFLSLPIKNMIAVGVIHILIIKYFSQSSLEALRYTSVESSLNLIQSYYHLAPWTIAMCYSFSLMYRLSYGKVVTDHKSLLKQYQLANLELQKANSRYKETVKLLEEANCKLESALKAKDCLLTSVSHELRNPLNSLLGHIQLLLEQITDKSQIEMLEICKMCGEILLSLINDFLDAAKIASNNLVLIPSCTNIYQLLERAWKINSVKIAQKNLKGYLDVESTLPRDLIIDGQRVMQILLNLMGNAIKFTDSGHVKIIVSWTDGDKPPEVSQSHESSPILRLWPSDRRSWANDIPASYYQLRDLEKTKLPSGDDIARKKACSNKLILTKKILLSDDDTEELKQSDCKHSTVFLPVPRFIEATPHKNYLKFEANNCLIASRMKEVGTARNGRKNGKGVLKIEVIDTGCGICEDSKSKLFQAFVQEDASITRKYGGTGLGLYITKKLIDKMQGKIDFKSMKNVGTSFTVSIPCQLPQDRTESNAFLEKKSLAKGGEFAGARALIVDDIDFNLKIMVSHCESLGIEGYVARNGEEGYNMFKSKPQGFFAFVTMDLQMPKLDGYSCCVLIRKYEKLAHGFNQVPIAIVTGNCSHHEESACMDKQGEVQAMRFFYKPLGFGEFRKFIASVLSK